MACERGAGAAVCGYCVEAISRLLPGSARRLTAPATKS